MSALHELREQYVSLHMARAGLDAGRRWDQQQAQLQRLAVAVQPRGYRLDEIPVLCEVDSEGGEC